MNATEFWVEVTRQYNKHYNKHNIALPAEEQQHENISDFLLDMNTIASTWYNRGNGEKESVPVERKDPKGHLLVVKGVFTWNWLGNLFGRAIYPKAYETKESYPCGFAGGKISYKIYNGIGGSSGGSAHVCLHSDGVCFSPSWSVDVDKALAQTLRDKVVAAMPMGVRSEE